MAAIALDAGGHDDADEDRDEQRDRRSGRCGAVGRAVTAGRRDVAAGLIAIAVVLAAAGDDKKLVALVARLRISTTPKAVDAKVKKRTDTHLITRPSRPSVFWQ